jgi:hypothetical protein
MLLSKIVCDWPARRFFNFGQAMHPFISNRVFQDFDV